MEVRREHDAGLVRYRFVIDAATLGVSSDGALRHTGAGYRAGQLPDDRAGHLDRHHGAPEDPRDAALILVAALTVPRRALAPALA
jgi:hypothetical protein